MSRHNPRAPGSIGRDAAVGTVRGLLADLGTRPSAGFLVVSGEPGIGKPGWSRIWRTSRRRTGQGSSSDAATPILPRPCGRGCRSRAAWRVNRPAKQTSVNGPIR